MAYAVATRDASQGYGGLAKLLHWTTAALVLLMIGLGLYMTQDGLDIGTRFRLYQLHKSVGVTILAITAVQIVSRQINGVPALPPHFEGWERIAARTAHGALYALLFAVTLTGWAMVSVAAFSIPTMLYGVIPWPHIPFLADLSPGDKKSAEAVFRQTHKIFAYGLAALIGVHVAAALRHALILKDGVMSRMLPRFLTRTSAILVCAALAIIIARPRDALAYEWDVNPETSRVGFETSAGGQAIKGAFERFKAEIRFDPDMPDEAAFDVAIDVASLKTGTAEVDKALPSAEWFDAARFPQATFRAKGAKRTGEGKYEVTGDLSIKGVSKPATLPFSLSIEGAEAAAEGLLTIDRATYGIGPETFAGGIPLPKDVKVAMSIKALRLDN